MRGIVLAASFLMCSSGCGTLSNLSSKAGSDPLLATRPRIYAPTQVYGGVKRDIEEGWPYYLDVPLSAIGDTATLPIVLADQMKSSKRDRSTLPAD